MVKYLQLNIAWNGKSNRCQSFRESGHMVEALTGENCESASGSETYVKR